METIFFFPLFNIGPYDPPTPPKKIRRNREEFPQNLKNFKGGGKNFLKGQNNTLPIRRLEEGTCPIPSN